MDPEVTRYFKKIVASFSIGFLWLFVIVTSGLYFGFALIDVKLHWYNILFYLFFLFSFCWLMYYYYRMWKNG
jgi:hypothetical protein